MRNEHKPVITGQLCLDEIMKEETDFFLMEAKISLEETWGKSFIKFSMPHVNPSCFVYLGVKAEL